MVLLWGAHAVRSHDISSFQEMVAEAGTLTVTEGFGQRGDRVVTLLVGDDEDNVRAVITLRDAFLNKHDRLNEESSGARDYRNKPFVVTGVTTRVVNCVKDKSVGSLCGRDAVVVSDTCNSAFVSKLTTVKSDKVE